MLKKIIRIKNDIFYSPSHNTFFRLEPSQEIDFSDYLLEISGHEEKIFEFLIYNYNNYVTKETLENEFPECSDPYDKTLDRLRRDKIEGKLKIYELIQKANGKVIMYLSESPFTAEGSVKKSAVPLLCRESYYVNYDKILCDLNSKKEENEPVSLLHEWIRECENIKQYDERCIMLLERISFLPAFGNKSDKLRFLSNAKKLIYCFEVDDINKYGGTELLIFTRSVIMCVIEYIEMQMKIIVDGISNDELNSELKKLLQHFKLIEMPENTAVNPLIYVAYYHYYGLILYRNYLIYHSKEQIAEAVNASEKSLQYAKKVDMHLQIWSAFLNYDLARMYSELEDFDKAVKCIDAAVILREGLAECPFFSMKMKNDLYFEYYLARIIQTDIKSQANCISDSETQIEYQSLFDEINSKYSKEDSWKHIFSMLSKRLKAD